MTQHIRDLVPSDNYLLHYRVDCCSYHLDRKKLSKILIESMIHHKGVGLSANQIGIWERAFAMLADGETTVCFNPRIIKAYTKKITFEEGCLTYPDQFYDVTRPASIVAKWEDEDGKIYKEKLTGFTARVFQHEYDHLEGVDFLERSTGYADIHPEKA